MLIHDRGALGHGAGEDHHQGEDEQHHQERDAALPIYHWPPPGVSKNRRVISPLFASVRVISSPCGSLCGRSGFLPAPVGVKPQAKRCDLAQQHPDRRLAAGQRILLIEAQTFKLLLAQTVADVLDLRAREDPQRVWPAAAAEGQSPVVALQLETSGEEKRVAVSGATGNDVGDIVGYLAKGALEGRDLLAFLAGQAIGADDVLQHHHGGGAEDGEDSQRQQRFDQSETAYFRYHGGVTRVRRVASGADRFFAAGPPRPAPAAAAARFPLPASERTSASRRPPRWFQTS